MSFLLNSIGITHTPIAGCELGTSESGLYLDRLDGLDFTLFGAYGTCEEPKSYVSRMLRSRESAASALEMDLIAALAKEHLYRKPNFEGYIGQRTGIGLAQSNQFTFKTGHFKDAYLHITTLGTATSGIGTAVITQTDDQGTDPVVYNLDITKEGYNTLPVDIKLPLDGTTYTFELSLAGPQALNNNVGCGCGQKDINLFRYLVETPAYAAGISLNASVRCPASDVVKRLYTSDETVKKYMAQALLYRSGVNLCDAILAEPEPTLITMTDLKHIMAKRGELLAEYHAHIDWLAESGMDVSDSACYDCSGGYGMGTL